MSKNIISRIAKKVRRILYPIVFGLKQYRSNSIFIDCGGYDGCTALKAIILYPFISQIVSFEPDIRMWSDKASKISTLIPAAVWIENGCLDFQIITKNKYGNKYAGAGTLMDQKKAHNNEIHKVTESIKVPTIHLSQWISKNCKYKKQIILKLDVEGAEYKILEDLLVSEVYKLINILYIEWHAIEWSGMEEEKAKRIKIETYAKFKKVKLWDAMEYSIVDKENDFIKFRINK